jgi:NADP-dependent 3-hydroxy acid dehydrogenase YdfG
VDHLDGVFLHAGIATLTPIESVTPKNIDDVSNVNVRGLSSSIAGSIAFPRQFDLFADKGRSDRPEQDLSG